MVEGVEADDVIGTLAKQASEAGIDTVISSSDKDLTQLVTARIKMVNTMSNETYDEAGVLAKFDVRPDQVLDLLTLTGDAVDNVPGVAKVGPKTAAKWLAQYGTLDNVVAHAHEIGGVVGNNLREALAWLPQGKRLLTVKTDCELPVRSCRSRDRGGGRRDAEIAVRALRVQAMAEGHRGRAKRRRDAAGEIAKRAANDAAGRRWDAERRTPQRRATPARPPKRTTKRCSTRRRLRAGSPRSIAPRSRRSTPKGRASIRCRRASSASRCRSRRDARATSRSVTATRARPPQLDRAATLARLAPWLADPSKKKLGQNVKYDEHALANEGLALRRRRARHAARVVRARVAQAARHGQPRVAAPERQDDHATTT